jgi:hypothetical protein
MIPILNAASKGCYSYHISVMFQPHNFAISLHFHYQLEEINRNCECGVASNGIIYKRNFIKIRPSARELKHADSWSDK